MAAIGRSIQNRYVVFPSMTLTMLRSADRSVGHCRLAKLGCCRAASCELRAEPVPAQSFLKNSPSVPQAFERLYGTIQTVSPTQPYLVDSNVGSVEEQRLSFRSPTECLGKRGVGAVFSWARNCAFCPHGSQSAVRTVRAIMEHEARARCTCPPDCARPGCTADCIAGGLAALRGVGKLPKSYTCLDAD